jgi:DNA (cytosine-5)-methyltransferase 1
MMKSYSRLDQNPTVIDLFAGAGGLSLGAARAGFSLAGAVELDERAMRTHTSNFPGAVHLKQDVGALSGRDLVSLCGLKRGEAAGLLGGPPCQGFSRMGHRLQEDPRNDMFAHFMRLVDEIRPAFFLAENVPGILDAKYQPLVASALAKVPKNYTLLPPFHVKASDYGAPTLRTRVIFFGYDPARLKDIGPDAFNAAKSSEAVHVQTALHGLPVDISDDWIDEASSWRRVAIRKAGHFFDRVTGVIPRGVGDPTTLARHGQRNEVHGNFGTRHSAALVQRYGALSFGETDAVSKSRRLDPAGFCPTLRAGTGPEKGSYQAVRPIHHLRPRVITPREAARLQGFPDWFKFDATKWHSFRQIGNSVSPLLAEALLQRVGLAIKA